MECRFSGDRIATAAIAAAMAAMLWQGVWHGCEPGDMMMRDGWRWVCRSGAVLAVVLAALTAWRCRRVTDRLPAITGWIIAATGVAEAVAGVAQIAGLTAPVNTRFILTGTFYNPGPYGCYLAVAMTGALALTGRNRGQATRWSRAKRCAAATAAAATAMLIPATESRTAMAAALAGAAMVAACCHGRQMAGWLRAKPWRRPAAIMAAGVATCSLIAAGYMVKPDSAAGRLQTWEATARATADHPLAGVGWERVPRAIADAQARWFAAEPEMTRAMEVAGSPDYAFNEWLQMALAWGWPVALAVMALVAWAAVTAWRRRDAVTAGMLAAMAVTATASYPLQFPMFAATGAMLVAAAMLPALCCCRRPARMAVAAVLVAAAVAMPTAGVDAADSRRDGRMLFAHGLALHRQGLYDRSTARLTEAYEVCGDPMIACVIGKNHQALGDYDAAARMYEHAANTVPTRLYPRFLKMKLWQEAGQDINTLAAAMKLLAMPVRVQSPATDEIRAQARATIDSLFRAKRREAIARLRDKRPLMEHWAPAQR